MNAQEKFKGVSRIFSNAVKKQWMSDANPWNTLVPRFSAVVIVGSSTEQDMMANGRGGKWRCDADQKEELKGKKVCTSTPPPFISVSVT